MWRQGTRWKKKSEVRLLWPKVTCTCSTAVPNDSRICLLHVTDPQSSCSIQQASKQKRCVKHSFVRRGPRLPSALGNARLQALHTYISKKGACTSFEQERSMTVPSEAYLVSQSGALDWHPAQLKPFPSYARTHMPNSMNALAPLSHTSIISPELP